MHLCGGIGGSRGRGEGKGRRGYTGCAKSHANGNGLNRYTVTCSRLLGQYKTILKNPGVAATFVDLDTFKREYNVASLPPYPYPPAPFLTHPAQINYPSATERLRIGVPATLEQPIPTTAAATSAGAPSGPVSAPSSARAAAEATQHFITFLDALRLNYTAKDQLHPLLSDVITAVNNIPGTGQFEGRAKIVQWLITLNGMRAGDEIDEGQRREMLFDLESAYHEFYKTLG